MNKTRALAPLLLVAFALVMTSALAYADAGPKNKLSIDSTEVVSAAEDYANVSCSDWENHGDFVSCIAKNWDDFASENDYDSMNKGQIIRFIAQADLGKDNSGRDSNEDDEGSPANSVSNATGAIDSIGNGSTVSGLVTVAGWAVDRAAASGTGVDRVQVYLDDVLKGTASYGGSRPDIASWLGGQFANSGFNFGLNLAGVSTGSHTITVKARSTVSGTETSYSINVTVPAMTSTGTGSTDETSSNSGRGNGKGHDKR